MVNCPSKRRLTFESGCPLRSSFRAGANVRITVAKCLERIYATNLKDEEQATWEQMRHPIWTHIIRHRV